MPLGRAKALALTLSLATGLAIASPVLPAGAVGSPDTGPPAAQPDSSSEAGAAPSGLQDTQDEGALTGGFLDWGIKKSFRSYIVGPIAQGSVTFEGGASQNDDGTFRFPLDVDPEPQGSFDPTTGAVEAEFNGSVSFKGHCSHSSSPGQCLLQLTIGDIRIQAGSTAGTLVADIVSLPLEGGTSNPQPGGEPVTYDDVVMATLDLTDVSPVSAVVGAYQGAAWLDVPTGLGSGGAPAFSGFYTEGTPLDPASYTLGLVDEVDLPDPPPADDEEPGVAVDKLVVAVGEPLTVTGAGFMPGEQVEVWVHSTPVWVGTAVADAAGAATYTFVMPPEVPAGEHQVEMRGISSGLSLWSGDLTVTGSVAGAAGGTPTASRGTLPATGPGDLNGPLALAGIGSLLFGAVLVGSSRRLRRLP